LANASICPEEPSRGVQHTTTHTGNTTTADSDPDYPGLDFIRILFNENSFFKLIKCRFFLQAAIPLAIYLPLVFNLVTIVFSMNLSGMTLGLQYYTMLSPIGMYFPATVDPLISILLIGHYRKAALWNFKFRLKITWKKANDVALNTPVNVSTLHQVDTRQNMRPIQGAYQAVVPPNKMETQINAHNGRR
jgi:hypothetical protein